MREVDKRELINARQSFLLALTHSFDDFRVTGRPSHQSTVVLAIENLSDTMTDVLGETPLRIAAHYDNRTRKNPSEMERYAADSVRQGSMKGFYKAFESFENLPYLATANSGEILRGTPSLPFAIMYAFSSKLEIVRQFISTRQQHLTDFYLALAFGKHGIHEPHIFNNMLVADHLLKRADLLMRRRVQFEQETMPRGELRALDLKRAVAFQLASDAWKTTGFQTPYEQDQRLAVAISEDYGNRSDNILQKHTYIPQDITIAREHLIGPTPMPAGRN